MHPSTTGTGIGPLPAGVPRLPSAALPPAGSRRRAATAAANTGTTAQAPPRRREPRAVRALPARFSVLPRPPSRPASEAAHVRDESAGGLCLLAARAPAPGTLIRIEILSLDGEGDCQLLGRVRWRQPAPGMGMRLGVEIVGVQGDAAPPRPVRPPGRPDEAAVARPPAPLHRARPTRPGFAAAAGTGR